MTVRWMVVTITVVIILLGFLLWYAGGVSYLLRTQVGPELPEPEVVGGGACYYPEHESFDGHGPVRCIQAGNMAQCEKSSGFADYQILFFPDRGCQQASGSLIGSLEASQVLHPYGGPFSSYETAGQEAANQAETYCTEYIQWRLNNNMLPLYRDSESELRSTNTFCPLGDQPLLLEGPGRISTSTTEWDHWNANSVVTCGVIAACSGSATAPSQISVPLESLPIFSPLEEPRGASTNGLPPARAAEESSPTLWQRVLGLF